MTLWGRAVAAAKLLYSSCKADLEGFSLWRGKTAGIVRDREGKGRISGAGSESDKAGR